GLAQAENPKRFAPDSAAVLDLIGEMLDEAGGGELPTWRIYEKLCSPPYGLPYALISLYLLCFVRHNQEPVVNLHLKPDHKLRLRSGAPPAHSLLRRGNVVQLTWKSGLERWFDLLAPTEDVWPQVVSFGRVLRDDLIVGEDASAVEQQQARLSETLADIRERSENTIRQLDLLSTALGHSLVADDQAALNRIEAISQADTYQSFYDCLSETYTQPEALQEDMATFRRLSELAAATAEIQAVKNYVGQMESDALPPELAGDRMAIQERLKLKTLAAQPSLWPSIHAQFKNLRSRYRSLYQIHHRDAYKAIAQIQDDLAEVARRLKGLQWLNTIEALGHPLGEGLPERYARLEARLETCDVAVNEVNVEVTPVCDSCRLPLSRQAPVNEACRLRRDLEDALGEQLRRLKTEAIRKVLAESETDRMEQLVKAIELSSLDSLVDVLDEELVTFITRTLEMQGVSTVPTSVLQRLADKHPVLEEKDIPDFIADLESLLEEAFAAARQEYPDKRTIRISLR
ncbi:MAG: hypothetical protein ACOC6F_02190, partial [bacterium]